MPTKTRPVSMMIPRSGTFGPGELPTKAAEAPEPSRPEPGPARPSFEIVSRPKLNRLKTPDFSLPPDGATRGIFTKGVYSDAPKVRAKIFDIGVPLLTQAHTRLIDALRDECARLHAYTHHLKAKLANASDKAQLTEEELQDLKAERVSLKVQNTQLFHANANLTVEMQQARDALAEVDAMFLDMRVRRLGQLRELSGDMASHQPELGEPYGRPKSPTPDSRSVL